MNSEIVFTPDSATLATSKNYSWSFGDGTASTIASPIHIYSTTGTFDVKMTVNGETSSITKTINITKYPGPYYMDRMSGIRHWEGTNSRNWGPTYPVADTLLNIDVIDSGLIKMNGLTINFASIDVAANTISYNDHLRSLLIYYYIKDSMVYHYTLISPVGHGGQLLYLHTK